MAGLETNSDSFEWLTSTNDQESIKEDTKKETENLKQDIQEKSKTGENSNLIKDWIKGIINIIKTPIEILDDIRKWIINEINEDEFKEQVKKRNEVVTSAIKSADKLPIRICYTDIENNINICYPEEINFDWETQSIIIWNERFKINIPDNPDTSWVKNCKLKDINIDGDYIIFNFSFTKSWKEYPDYKSTKSKKELIEIITSLLNTWKYEKKGNYIIIDITKEQ